MLTASRHPYLLSAVLETRRVVYPNCLEFTFRCTSLIKDHAEILGETIAVRTIRLYRHPEHIALSRPPTRINNLLFLLDGFQGFSLPRLGGVFSDCGLSKRDQRKRDGTDCFHRKAPVSNADHLAVANASGKSIWAGAA